MLGTRAFALLITKDPNHHLQRQIARENQCLFISSLFFAVQSLLHNFWP